MEAVAGFSYGDLRIDKLVTLTHSYCKGFFLHPGLLVDANDYAILGISDIIHGC